MEEIDISIHTADHIIDLIFFNMIFAFITVCQDLHCSSDHQSIITILSITLQIQLSSVQLKIINSQLKSFADLIRDLMTDISDSDKTENAVQLNNLTQYFTQSLLTAV